MEEKDPIILTIRHTVEALILRELGELVYPNGIAASKTAFPASPFIKFLPIITCIEFLGACYDESPFNKDGLSETRFNKALIELFPKKYVKFSKKSAQFYFYENLRCGMVHQLKPLKGIYFSTRYETHKENVEHLSEFKKGRMVLILEDFYDDLKKAAEKLLKKFETGKLTNKKGDQAFLSILHK